MTEETVDAFDVRVDVGFTTKTRRKLSKVDGFDAQQGNQKSSQKA